MPPTARTTSTGLYRTGLYRTGLYRTGLYRWAGGAAAAGSGWYTGRVISKTSAV